ncbi:porin family protein [Vibrio sp. T187]|uniref:porin family protein n=1 Tax=Vibrio TaxID=662 RepID=UPI0010C9DB92|nr:MULTISPECIES: porin family protein [Vibrio]MBW3698323.1 porin family protein [Vibrio sp. T187]
MNHSSWLATLIATFGLNAAAFAQQDTPETPGERQGGFYIGADLSGYNTVDLQVGSTTSQKTGDLGDFGFNIVGGYEFNTHKVIKLGVEAEYRKLGSVEYQDTLKLKGDALFVNVKPKFIVNYDYADVYVSLLAGVGSLDLEASANGTSASQTEAGVQIGAEIGVILTHNIDLHAGYRAAYASVDSLDVTVGSGYAGVRYHF